MAAVSSVAMMIFLRVSLCQVMATFSLTSSSAQYQEFLQWSKYSAKAPCSDEYRVSCPPGLFCVDGLCECGQDYPNNILTCNGTHASVLDCNCATFDNRTNVSSVGACMLTAGLRINSPDRSFFYTALPRDVHSLSKQMCRPFNRTGALCGRCLPNHYPLAYSYNMTCVHCHHKALNWLKYIAAAYLPLTLFYFVILFFEINVSSSYLHSIIFHLQAVSAPVQARIWLIGSNNYSTALRSFLSLVSIWNLDFFRSFYSGFCLGLGVLPTLALDYAIAVYPLFLMIITYLLIFLYDRNYRVVTILWRPFHILFYFFKENWDFKTSLIDAFATFLLLMSIKFLNVSFDLLIPVKSYQLHVDHSNSTLALYYAGDVEYLGSEHLPYAVLAIIVMAVFYVIPVSLLTLYPFAFFQKFLNLLPVRWYVLHTFMDLFLGCYKNGTEPGTRDCRWFASLYFLLRLALFIVYSFTLNVMYYVVGAFVLTFFSILLITVQPYRSAHNNLLSAIFIQFLALLYISLAGVTLSGVFSRVQLVIGATFVFGLTSLLYGAGVVLYWLFKNRMWGLQVFHRIRAWRRGYDVMSEESDNWRGIHRVENYAEYHRGNLTPFDGLKNVADN